MKTYNMWITSKDTREFIRTELVEAVDMDSAFDITRETLTHLEECTMAQRS